MTIKTIRIKNPQPYMEAKVGGNYAQLTHVVNTKDEKVIIGAFPSQHAANLFLRAWVRDAPHLNENIYEISEIYGAGGTSLS